MGDTVNLASRLEQLAPGRRRAHLARDVPQRAWGVRRPSPRRGGGAGQARAGPALPRRAGEAACVPPPNPRRRGCRDADDRSRRGAAPAAGRVRSGRRRRRGGGRRVVADAGTGKSRLLYEFLNWLELLPSSVYLFTGRALAIRQGAALGLFRDVIATRFGVHDSDSAPTVAEKLRRGFAPCLSAEEAEIVGRWFGFELSSSAAVQHLLGPQFAATARTHLVEFFASLAATDPVVLALEDLHWADDESLELLDELTSRLRERSVLVVALTRPSLLDRRADVPGRDVSGRAARSRPADRRRLSSPRSRRAAANRDRSRRAGRARRRAGRGQRVLRRGADQDAHRRRGDRHVVERRRLARRLGATPAQRHPVDA